MDGRFGEEEIAEEEGVHTGAIEAAEGIARRDDEGLAEKIEGSIDEQGCGRSLTGAAEEAPEGRIIGLGNDLEANELAGKDELGRKLGEGGKDASHGGHKACEGGAIEEARAILFRDGEGKGTEGFAVLDKVVEIFADVGSPGRSEEAAIAEGARAELGAMLAPGNDFALVEEVECGLDAEGFGIEPVVGGLAIIEDGLDLFAGKGGPPIGQGHGRRARKAEELMASEPSGAERGAFVTSGGLNEDAAETGAALDGGNEKGVEEKTAGEAEGIEGSFAAEGFRELDEDLREGVMEAGGDIGADGIGKRGGIGNAEGGKEGIGKGDMAGEAAIEELIIEARSERAGATKHFEEEAGIEGLTRESEPLGFVFVLLRAETEEVGDLGVNPGEGMRERDAEMLGDGGARADADEGGDAIALLIAGEDEGAIERGSVEGAGGVAEMVIESDDAIGGATSELAEEAEVIEVAGEFAEGAGLVIGAGDGSGGKSKSAKMSAAKPGAAGTTCDSDAVEVRG